MRFSVGIWKYDRDPHTKCFEDFARALAEALRRLGHDVVPPWDAEPGRLIIFGGNNITDEDRVMPEDAIIFNTEQLAAIKNPLDFFGGAKYFKNKVIWDYSLANIGELYKIGFQKLVHCPVGYIDTMTTIVSKEVEDIDILFYGAISTRRRQILDSFRDAGLEVTHLYNKYGKERDDLVARAKIILNLHYFKSPIFEIFRVSHALSNLKCVVSENGGQDLQLEEFASRATEYVPSHRLVEACKRLLANEELRKTNAHRGFVEFQKLNLVSIVKNAIDATVQCDTRSVAPQAVAQEF